MKVIAEAIAPDRLSDDTQPACIVQPVVLAGGSGTRLWPLSREQCPKQLIGLTGDESLLEATLRRAQGLRAPTPGYEAPHAAPHVARMQPTLVVCSEELRLATNERLERSGCDARVILEPAPRNTAPALTVAALAALADAPAGEDPVLVVMPADHLIVDGAAFIATLQQAIHHAQRDAIVALGVPPERAETGYGYIRTGAPADEHGARTIGRFVEKPAQETAERYLASGEYWWNSGIFVMRASVWLAAIAACRPDIAAACSASYENARILGSEGSNGPLQLERSAFAACPNDSIDYAVMERIGDDPRLAGVVVPLTAGWSDVGAWDAVWDISAKDSAGNVARGRVLLEGARDTYAHSEGRLVACVGVTGVVVIETADAVLVAAKDRVQDVKAVVNRLNAAQHTEAKVHRKVERPWGCYDSIDRGERFQVKRIVVKPGGRLSLQMHHHRAGTLDRRARHGARDARR